MLHKKSRSMIIFYDFQVSAVGDLMNNSWDTNNQENRKGKYISKKNFNCVPDLNYQGQYVNQSSSIYQHISFQEALIMQRPLKFEKVCCCGPN